MNLPKELTPAANKLKVPMKIVQSDAHVAKADLAQAGAPKLILPKLVLF